MATKKKAKKKESTPQKTVTKSKPTTQKKAAKKSEVAKKIEFKKDPAPSKVVSGKASPAAKKPAGKKESPKTVSKTKPAAKKAEAKKESIKQPDAKKASHKPTKPAESSEVARPQPPSQPPIAGRQFADEDEFMEYIKDAKNQTPENLQATHIINEISDLDKLFFDLNRRPYAEAAALNLVKSIKTIGIQEPILITFTLNDKKLQVTRGQHRVKAMIELRKKCKDGKMRCPERNQIVKAKVVVYASGNTYRDDKRAALGDAISNVTELTAQLDPASTGEGYLALAETLAKRKNQPDDDAKLTKDEQGKKARAIKSKVNMIATSFALKKTKLRDCINVANLLPETKKLIKDNINLLKDKFLYREAAKVKNAEANFIKALRKQAMEQCGVQFKFGLKLTQAQAKDVNGKLEMLLRSPAKELKNATQTAQKQSFDNIKAAINHAKAIEKAKAKAKEEKKNNPELRKRLADEAKKKRETKQKLKDQLKLLIETQIKDAKEAQKLISVIA